MTPPSVISAEVTSKAGAGGSESYVLYGKGAEDMLRTTTVEDAEAERIDGKAKAAAQEEERLVVNSVASETRFF